MTIKTRLVPPNIPLGANYIHYGSSWELSLYPDMSVIEQSSYENTVDKLEYSFTVNDDTVHYYVRSKVIFEIGGNSNNRPESPWSNVVAVNRNGVTFMMSDTLIETPKLSMKRSQSYTGIIDIPVKASVFNQIDGNGIHNKTTFELLTFNNYTIWSAVLAKSEDSSTIFSLTDITIPKNVLSPNKAYIFRCKYTNKDDVESNYGELHFSTGNQRAGYLYE